MHNITFSFQCWIGISIRMRSHVASETGNDSGLRCRSLVNRSHQAFSRFTPGNNVLKRSRSKTYGAFRSAGMRRADAPPEMAIAAAVDGLGAVLESTLLANRELKNGMLACALQLLSRWHFSVHKLEPGSVCAVLAACIGACMPLSARATAADDHRPTFRCAMYAR